MLNGKYGPPGATLEDRYPVLGELDRRLEVYISGEIEKRMAGESGSGTQK